MFYHDCPFAPGYVVDCDNKCSMCKFPDFVVKKDGFTVLSVKDYLNLQGEEENE